MKSYMTNNTALFVFACSEDFAKSLNKDLIISPYVESESESVPATSNLTLTDGLKYRTYAWGEVSRTRRTQQSKYVPELDVLWPPSFAPSSAKVSFL